MGMLASKTVVYVTHQIEFLPAADLILVRHFHSRHILRVHYCLFKNHVQAGKIF